MLKKGQTRFAFIMEYMYIENSVWAWQEQALRNKAPAVAPQSRSPATGLKLVLGGGPAAETREQRIK